MQKASKPILTLKFLRNKLKNSKKGGKKEKAYTEITKSRKASARMQASQK